MADDRSILHVDMDAFFASVEQLDDPRLRGKPVLVGHDGPRGVVTAASYESRVFGCRSAQPMAVAKRMCPRAIVVPSRYWRYREASDQVFEIFERYTPAIEPLSIDEAFLDVTGCQPLHGPAPIIAAQIKLLIKAKLGLTASVGVAPNKFLAKLASDMDKPDGLRVIRGDEAASLLAPLAVSRMWGVGPKMEAVLRDIGVTTFGHLRTIPVQTLAMRLGMESAEHFRRLALGIDSRPVTTDREAKSIGQEQTFGSDLTEMEGIHSVLLEQCEEVGARLRRHQLRAKSLSVKIRFGNFQTVTRRCTLEEPTDATRDIWNAARDQFDRWAAAGFRPVRLIGVTAGSLGSGQEQLELFANPTAMRQRKLDQTVDQINKKFGGSTISRGKPGARE